MLNAAMYNFNDHTKTRGFLAHESLEFAFTGPHRQIPDLKSYIDMARLIKATGVPITRWLDSRFSQISTLMPGIVILQIIPINI